MKLNKRTIFAISWRALLIACILGGYWLAVQPSGQKQASIDLGQSIDSPAPGVITKRIVYRYSVVEGGVHTEADIEEARQDDPIVDEHYRYTPKPERLALITAVVKGYVSYRKGNQVYWTKRPVEFTDWVWAGDVAGKFRPVIRARCGNRVSDIPMMPVLAEEPDLDVLELDGRLAMLQLPAPDLLAGLPLVTDNLGALGAVELPYIDLADLGQDFLNGLAFLDQIEPLAYAQAPVLLGGGLVSLPAVGLAVPPVDFGPVPEPGTWLVGIALVLGAIRAKSRG